MRIKEITSQYRRDFVAVIECEHCGYIDQKFGGYDDAYFHNTVIPGMKCPKCGETAGENYRALSSKYPEHFVI